VLELALRLKGLEAEESTGVQEQVDTSSSSAQTDSDEEIRRLRYRMVPKKTTNSLLQEMSMEKFVTF
jgi:hypothetical protein